MKSYFLLLVTTCKNTIHNEDGKSFPIFFEHPAITKRTKTNFKDNKHYGSFKLYSQNQIGIYAVGLSLEIKNRKTLAHD